MPPTKQRLLELLDEKDEELGKLQEEVEDLAAKLEAAGETPRLPKPLTWKNLPVPRLELVYLQHGNRGWGSFSVSYRMVYRHIEGHLDWTLFSWVHTIRGGVAREPNLANHIDLPIRAGNRIHYDSLMLKIPAYYLIGDKADGKWAWRIDVLAWSAREDTDIIAVGNRAREIEQHNQKED